jgi:K+:H+ antiporter subunit KhtT
MGVRRTSRVLPGIGLCQELALLDGHRIGIVTRRTGLRDLVVLDDDGGDGVQAAVTLTDDEADTVAELLGAPQVVSRLSSLQSEAAALLVEQLPIPHNSPYRGRPLRDTRARGRTGASIVAVMRGGATQPSPGPDFVFESGDLVVAVGTREGLDQIGRILDGTG